MLRRVRATLAIAVAWAIPWTLGGLALGALQMLTHSLRWRYEGASNAIREMFLLALAWGILGAINGVIFAVLLATVGRRRLTGSRVVALGGVAGAVLPLLAFSVLWPALFRISSAKVLLGTVAVVALGAALGALLAAGTFAAARHEALDA